MIQEQVSSEHNYQPSRSNFYNINTKRAEPSFENLSLELSQPHSKLLFIGKSIQKLADHNLFAIQHVQEYLLTQYRRNRSIRTIQTNFGSIFLFLKHTKMLGRKRFEELSSDDLCAYIECEQDQGKKPLTVHTRLRSLKAFFNYHIDRGNIDASILKRKLRIKLPQRLPRAIDPEDIRQLLAVIEKLRDRALIITLLRTGMRIGELLSTQIGEVNLPEKRIEIYQAHKNLTGRVVYLSTDAQDVLDNWIKMRSSDTPYLFHGPKGKPLSYEAARMTFVKCLSRAGLSHKGYTLHCLRHTFASELLNAGMRLECLQQLLGHSDIEMTRVYARLTDVTRRDEYFKAMTIIEKGEINGHYRRGCPIP
jgi:site-specific recombinase XerD